MVFSIKRLAVQDGNPPPTLYTPILWNKIITNYALIYILSKNAVTNSIAEFAKRTVSFVE